MGVTSRQENSKISGRASVWMKGHLEGKIEKVSFSCVCVCVCVLGVYKGTVSLKRVLTVL